MLVGLIAFEALLREGLCEIRYKVIVDKMSAELSPMLLPGARSAMS